MSVAANRPFYFVGFLRDAVQLIAAVLFVPFAILAVGAPFALLLAGLLWLARMARAAF